MSPFAQLLIQAIKEAGLTQHEFAKLVGVGRSFISMVKRGDRLPPLATLPEWAKVLGLKGEKRKRFLQLAGLEHCPRDIQELVIELLEQK